MDRISIHLSSLTNSSKVCFGPPLSSNEWERIRRKSKWVVTMASLTRTSLLKCATRWVFLEETPRRSTESYKVYPNLAVLCRVNVTNWDNKGRTLQSRKKYQTVGLCLMMAANTPTQAPLKNLSTTRTRTSRENLCVSWARLAKMKMRTTSSFEQKFGLDLDYWLVAKMNNLSYFYKNQTNFNLY